MEQEMKWKKIMKSCMDNVKMHFADIDKSIDFGAYIQPCLLYTSTVCGAEYVPRSAISKYCPECRKRIRKVQGTETKRRGRERNRQACIELSAKNDRLIWNNRREEFCGRAIKTRR